MSMRFPASIDSLAPHHLAHQKKKSQMMFSLESASLPAVGNPTDPDSYNAIGKAPRDVYARAEQVLVLPRPKGPRSRSGHRGGREVALNGQCAL
jgi:hypothetical protein